MSTISRVATCIALLCTVCCSPGAVSFAHRQSWVDAGGIDRECPSGRIVPMPPIPSSWRAKRINGSAEIVYATPEGDTTWCEHTGSQH